MVYNLQMSIFNTSEGIKYDNPSMDTRSATNYGTPDSLEGKKPSEDQCHSTSVDNKSIEIDNPSGKQQKYDSPSVDILLVS